MTLQEQLDALRAKDVPIPLIGVQAITQALRLREAGLTYDAISKTMVLYHGVSKSADWWRKLLREHGAAPKHFANGKRRIIKRAA